MKITTEDPKNPFRPITIRLETPAEAEGLLEFFNQMPDRGPVMSTFAKRLAHEIRAAILRSFQT